MKIIKLTRMQIDCSPSLLEGGENVLFQDNFRYKLGKFLINDKDGEKDLVIECSDGIYSLDGIYPDEFYLLECPTFTPENWTDLSDVVEL